VEHGLLQRPLASSSPSSGRGITRVNTVYSEDGAPGENQAGPRDERRPRLAWCVRVGVMTSSAPTAVTTMPAIMARGRKDAGSARRGPVLATVGDGRSRAFPRSVDVDAPEHTVVSIEIRNGAR